MPLAWMLAALASIDASLCGVFRAFFGCFLSLLSGMKTSAPLAAEVTAVVSITAVVMVFAPNGLGLKRSAALQPCPSARPGGCKGQGGRGGGGSPGLHKRISVVAEVLKDVSARKVGETTPAGAACRASPLPAPGGSAPKHPPGVSVSGSRAREPDQDVQRCKTGKTCIVIAALSCGSWSKNMPALWHDDVVSASAAGDDHASVIGAPPMLIRGMSAGKE